MMFRKILKIVTQQIRKIDMETNKNVSAVVTELFLRERKRNILLAFLSLSYFKAPETIRLNATHYFI